eukprot:8972569-Pyramimonas_sp.AAC.1
MEPNMDEISEFCFSLNIRPSCVPGNGTASARSSTNKDAAACAASPEIGHVAITHGCAFARKKTHAAEIRTP